MSVGDDVLWRRVETHAIFRDGQPVYYEHRVGLREIKECYNPEFDDQIQPNREVLTNGLNCEGIYC